MYVCISQWMVNEFMLFIFSSFLPSPPPLSTSYTPPVLSSFFFFPFSFFLSGLSWNSTFSPLSLTPPTPPSASRPQPSPPPRVHTPHVPSLTPPCLHVLSNPFPRSRPRPFFTARVLPGRVGSIRFHEKCKQMYR